MDKKNFLLILVFHICFLSGNQSIHPMVKSAILPGWGEAVQGYPKSSRLFLINESVLLLSCIGSYTLSKLEAEKYRTFAAEFAGAKGHSDHRYWVDIGNFHSIDEYDSEHLRMRDGMEGKWAGWNWEWDTVEHRKKFELMRIHSDRLSLAGQFFIGGIFLNHIVSAINALYLSRLGNIESFSITPTIADPDQTCSWRINIVIAL